MRAAHRVEVQADHLRWGHLLSAVWAGVTQIIDGGELALEAAHPRILGEEKVKISPLPKELCCPSSTARKHHGCPPSKRFIISHRGQHSGAVKRLSPQPSAPPTTYRWRNQVSRSTILDLAEVRDEDASRTQRAAKLKQMNTLDISASYGMNLRRYDPPNPLHPETLPQSTGREGVPYRGGRDRRKAPKERATAFTVAPELITNNREL